MLGMIANTDYGWCEFLSGRQLPEVNFWTPSAKREFRAAPLSPFLFKLKAPLTTCDKTPTAMTIHNGTANSESRLIRTVNFCIKQFRQSA
jgi:hypothetical protein